MGSWPAESHPTSLPLRSGAQVTTLEFQSTVKAAGVNENLSTETHSDESEGSSLWWICQGRQTTQKFPPNGKKSSQGHFCLLLLTTRREINLPSRHSDIPPSPPPPPLCSLPALHRPSAPSRDNLLHPDV